MTDSLRTRLTALMGAHWFNDWGVNDADMCACGECPPNGPDDDGQGSKWAEHVADAVIRELEADYVLVPKSHTIATAVTGRRDCNPHPDAPHGFDRNASHSEDRYVCDCEDWEPPDPWEERAADERKDWADD